MKESIDNSKINKKLFRKKFRDKRYHMDPNEKNMADYSIFTKLLNSYLYKKADSIFIYVSVKDEVDTLEIIKKSLELGKKIYVPYISNRENFEMRPVRIYDIDNLELGEFNIPTSYSMEFEDNPDISIIPGLGFDKDKNRLGYGGGYYDKFLNKSNTISIGIFQSAYKVDQLPTDEYDHKLDYIITEKEIF